MGTLAFGVGQTLHLCLVVQVPFNLKETLIKVDSQHTFAAMGISEEILVFFRIVRSHKGKFNSMVFFLVLFVAVLWLVFSCAVADKCVFLGPLPMFLEHQHPLVVGVGRSSRKKESNTFTFGLGLFHLFLRQTLAAPEPCIEKENRVQ